MVWGPPSPGRGTVGELSLWEQKGEDPRTTELQEELEKALGGFCRASQLSTGQLRVRIKAGDTNQASGRGLGEAAVRIKYPWGAGMRMN